MASSIPCESITFAQNTYVRRRRRRACYNLCGIPAINTLRELEAHSLQIVLDAEDELESPLFVQPLAELKMIDPSRWGGPRSFG